MYFAKRLEVMKDTDVRSVWMLRTGLIGRIEEPILRREREQNGKLPED